MAYIFFGSSPADVTTDDQGNVVGGITLQVWSQQTGGTRITDLRDSSGQPLPGVVESNPTSGADQGRIRFQASDQYTVLYLDRGYGDRWMVTSDRLSVIVAEAVARSQTALTQSGDALAASTEAKQSADHAFNTVTKIRTDVTAFGAIGDGIKDDREAFQAAIDSNPYGAHVIIPKGTYRIGVGKLLLRAGTWLEAEPGAHIIRSSDDYLLANGIQGIDTSTGYDGPGNIRITGGIWDGNGAEFPSKASIMHLAHASNVIVERAELRDVAQSHHIELNSTQHALITDSIFRGYIDATGTAGNEAIQIDMAYPGATIIGADDGTPCRDITIRSCVFGRSDNPADIGIGSAIGSHTQLAGKRHTGVLIDGCMFDQCRGPAVKLLAYTDATVRDCVATSCLMMIASVSGDRITLTGNHLKGASSHGIVIDAGRGTIITGNTLNSVQGLAPNGTDASSAITAVSGATRVQISANVITDMLQANTKPAIYVTGSCAAVRVADNIIRPKITGDQSIYNGASDSTVDADGNIV